MRIIDTSKWKPFALGKLFKIEKGKRLTKADMREGEINFIGASAMNNGITAKIGNTEHLHPANTITVSYNGSVGEAFYQDAPFWASDDINVLYPRFKLTRQIAFFMIPYIRAIGKRYAFVDKWQKEVMEKDCILLPAIDKDTPDYTAMEEYIKSREDKVKSAVDALQLVIESMGEPMVSRLQAKQGK